MAVYAEFSTDYDDIRECILKHWSDFSEDGMVVEGWDVPKDWVYVALVNDEKVIGYQFYNQLNSISYEIHTVIKKNYRGLDSSFMGQMCGLKLMFEETSCHKIIAEIPAYRIDVINYAKRAGMRCEGTNVRSWLKYGHIWDQVRLGLTKSQFEEPK